MPKRQWSPATTGVFCACVGFLTTAGAVHGTEKPTVTNGGYMQARARGKTVVLPLKHTDVEAEVAGTVASVQVKQQFHNPYRTPIEAVYVFPLPQRAAVYSMKLQVGKRTIVGVVKRRADARRIYQRAKRRGKTAALLEQERPNIFTQSVANILPGDQIDVTIRYVEDLLPVGARYSFVFPMVVGPRYVGGERLARKRRGSGWSPDTTQTPDASRITPPVLKKGQRPGNDIAVRLRIDGGVPVKHLQVVTHSATVQQQGNTATVVLDPRDAIPNKDFVVRYQLAGKQPEVALLAHKGKRGGHFLLMVQPKARMKKADIAPREYVFVVDNSGSMYGFPMAQARRVVKRCLGALRGSETFQIIKFAGSPDQFSPKAVRATRANIERATSWVGQMHGGGGTEFLPALKLALLAPKDPARSRIVVFITDGYIGYESRVLQYLRQHGKQSNLFALGVGSAVNRFLIDGMARIGGGEPFYLLNNEKANSVAERLFATVSKPALTNIRVRFSGAKTKEMTPSKIPDLFGERPVVIAGRYTRAGQATVTVRGMLAGQAFSRQLTVNLPDAPTNGHAAVPLLWARRQIAWWMDRHRTEPELRSKAERRVTRVALSYNLLSSFTSMVAVDQRIRNRGGNQQTRAVAVPLPAGVSERAVPANVMGGNKSSGSYGYGGLGLSGTARGGGGGTGSGSIGLGTLGTIGRGGGGGSGAGYGRGYGRLVGRRAHAPRIAMGRATVAGSLDASIIRRIIRRRINTIRFCYVKGLQSNRTLAGKVVVRLAIAPTGKVVHVKISSSTLNDKAVEACVLKSMKVLTFPKANAAGGIIIVSYPFIFQPAR